MSANQSTVLVLGAGTHQVPVIKKAKTLGYQVISVDRNADAPGHQLADTALVMSTYEAAPILEALSTHPSKDSLVGIINRSSGPPVLTFAALSQSLNLPGVTLSNAEQLLNKSALMDLGASLNLPVPSHQKITAETSPSVWSGGWPCIIKPAIPKLGKAHVFRVDSPDDWSAAVQSATAMSHNVQADVQQFITGDDVILMAMVSRGKLCPMGLIDEINTFTGEGAACAQALSVPSKLTGIEVEARIHQIAQSLIDALSLNTTAFLLSFRVTPEGTPYLIEIHLDFGGDAILDTLLPSASDFDYLGTMIHTMCGQTPNFPTTGFKPFRLNIA